MSELCSIRTECVPVQCGSHTSSSTRYLYLSLLLRAPLQCLKKLLGGTTQDIYFLFSSCTALRQ